MKYFFLFLLCHVAIRSIGQVNPTDSVVLHNWIEKVEQTTPYRFYYRESWVNEVFVPDFDYSGEGPIEEALSNVLEPTSISFYIDEQRVILTNNTLIIAQPAISRFFDEDVAQDVVEKGYIFSREYTTTTDNPEEQTYEIGSRNRYVPGGRSTIAGYLRDAESGNPVEGVSIYIEDPFTGTSSASDGFYSLTIPNGPQRLQVQSIDMKNTFRNVMLLSNGKLDIDLYVDVIALNAVTVSADRELNVTDPKMGLTKINTADIKMVPTIFGEADVIRVATTTAGVQNLGEGSAGVNVRGGKVDQNLFLLDGAPIYNSNHFFGFFSVFNSASIESMDLYKNGIPANYGSRLSSVFDIRSKTPNKEKFSMSGGIGPVTSKLQLETPLYKGGPSIMLGGRATYSDFLINQLTDSRLANNDVRFYDVVGKIDHKFSDKDEVSFTAYYSFDEFKLTADTLLSFSDFSYRNRLLAANWRHVFNDALQANFRVANSRYDYDIQYDELASQAFRVNYDLTETNGSATFDLLISDKLSYLFGAEVKHYKINPGMKRAFGEESIVLPDNIRQEQGLESALFFSAQYNPSVKFSIDGGLRYSLFNSLGPDTTFVYNPNGPRNAANRTDTLTFDKGESTATYHGPELRLSARYSLTENSSVKASYNRTRQYLHLLLNAASIAPTDNWRLSNRHIKPQIADQFSLGYFRNIYGKSTYELSAEVYYKRIQNLIDFKVGADLQFNKSIETSVLQGPGRAYGLELSVKKKKGWLTGWINYTYSRSLIQLNGNFPEEIINGGEYFPTGYDKPHYLNSITNYKFTRRLSMTLNLVYATGVPVTYPVGKWSYKDSENILYSNRNDFRIPDYFRVDIGINLEGSHKIKKLAHSFWTFSIYNLFGRDNIYSVFFNVENGEVKAYKLTVFENPVPTITYNFSF